MSTTITQLLTSSRNGDKAALNELLPLVYAEMRRLAKGFLSRERVGHTLQPTALVHEVYLRLAGQSPVEWQNRAHFFGAASRLMREILIDHARSRNRKKRGGELRTFIEIEEAAPILEALVAKSPERIRWQSDLSEVRRLIEKTPRD